MTVAPFASWGTNVIIGLAIASIILAGLGAVGLYLSMRVRKALAASLVGEIAEVLSVIEMHDIEGMLGRYGDVVSAPISLPRFSEVAYRSQVDRLGLLRSHSVRLIAAFYESLAILRDELGALASEASKTRRTERAHLILRELQNTLDLGDMALRDLRIYLSRHDASTLRA